MPWVGLCLQKNSVHYTSQACLPMPSAGTGTSSEPTLNRQAPGKRPHPWRRPLWRVAATSDLTHRGGSLPTGPSVRNRGDSPARVPKALRVADQSKRYLPTPCARGRTGPHSRRAAVAVLISDRLDAAGAGHSDVAALEAQVYAHHRHGAGYSSGSSPGPAGETGHGPRWGWRAECGPRVPGGRG